VDEFGAKAVSILPAKLEGYVAALIDKPGLKERWLYDSGIRRRPLTSNLMFAIITNAAQIDQNHRIDSHPLHRELIYSGTMPVGDRLHLLWRYDLRIFAQVMNVDVTGAFTSCRL
jgi:hypothetical protein